MNTENRYDDIINLRHYSSPARPRMSRMNRAAQFAPFAALTGYAAAVTETARLTDKRHELTEDERIMLSEKLHILSENEQDRPVVRITYFLPDIRKSGGSYEAVTGAVRRIDEGEMKIIFTDGTRIDIADIYDIEGDVFDNTGIKIIS
ncbi:MAG: hypothetical protein IJY73_10005 [Oscillospiraceae bacterium]|nr:hypothetical protein [Oscillospiraceae bacterium]